MSLVELIRDKREGEVQTLTIPSRKKHHYIPVFYLKQWAVDGRLCEFSRPYKTPEGLADPDIKSIPVKPRRTCPDGTGYIKNLYTFSALRPELANYLEDRFFLRVDDQAAIVMQRLLRGDVEFDSQSKSAWTRFLMSMFHRSPEGINRVITHINEGFPANAEEFRTHYDALRTDDEQPTFEEFLDSLAASDFQEFSLQTLRNVMDSQRVGAVLNSMIWTVVPNIAHHPLFTSDRPITMSALGAPNAHLTMPLTPRHIFIAAANAETMNFLDNKNRYGGLAEIINNRVARQARKYVYAIDDSRQNFLINRLGDRQQWSPLE
jgi:hypothetical protein